jgi:ribosomal protein L22
MADKPGNPSEGKVDAEKVEAEAAEAKAAASTEAAEEKAEATRAHADEVGGSQAPQQVKKTRAKKAAPKPDEDKPGAPAAGGRGSAARKPRAKKAAAEEPAAEAEAAEEAPAEEKPKRARKPAADKPAAEEAKPAPSRRGRRAAPERVVVRAHAKYVRTSARKARLVCDHIRGKDVAEARAILLHTNRQVAEAWTKLLESAVANAAENHSLEGEDLRVAFITADEGPTLKRFRPRAMGRATKIRKRTSHLSIGLEPKE